MKCSHLAPEARDDLLIRIRQHARTIGPVEDARGICRLAPIGSWSDLSRQHPLLPCKKFVLPSRDLLWSLADGDAHPHASSRPIALIGLYPCDLYALSYLDRVFAGDRAYEQRRCRLWVIGRTCESTPDCFCPPRDEPPFFDLFLAEERIWSGSLGGDSLLKDMACLKEEAVEDEPFPDSFRAGLSLPQAIATDLEKRMPPASSPFWTEEARRCLSCGSCSAVCPTCYCYDMVDEVDARGGVDRLRIWDNCFFTSHGEVAGGHNFRPGRGARLRFRFEHKFLGFGELRGMSSCVGCGRCTRACPVGIDIAAVLQRVQQERGAGDEC